LCYCEHACSVLYLEGRLSPPILRDIAWLSLNSKSANCFLTQK
jgi:hypothetical protein